MSFDFATKAKKLTHVLAVALATAAGFAMTDAGQALIKQYPKLAGVAGMLGVAALYFNPKN